MISCRVSRRWVSAVLFCCAVSWSSARAQLDQVFTNVFSGFLDSTSLQLSPPPHGGHFTEAAKQANIDIVRGLNSLIAGNVASFPQFASSARVLFDFSGDQPVSIPSSLGPIFGETARPLGTGKLALEVGYTYLDLDHFRGLPTDQMQFTFTHAHLTSSDTLGHDATESDYMTVSTDMHVTAKIAAITAVYGITKDLDVGFALPLIQVSLSGTARATISSWTWASTGFAFHYFGGTITQPVLTKDSAYSQSATGIGDLAVRAKYSFLRGGDADLSALLDLRLPTGKKEDFLGTGRMTFLAWGVLSRRFGSLTPHLNLGYAKKNPDFQSDAIELRAGFDNMIYPELTFALDILGEVNLNSSKAVHIAPGTVLVLDQKSPNSTVLNQIPRSNVPDSNSDNLYSAAIGFRYGPSVRWQMFANMLLPLNSAGLRAAVATTIGLSARF